LLVEVDVNGRRRSVELRRTGGRLTAVIGGRECTVDAARVDAHTWSLLIGGEVGRQPDPPAGAAVGSALRPAMAASYEVSLASEPVSGGLTVCVGSTPMAVLINGRRRWGRKEEGGEPGSGPQRIVATMPGKVVRVVVKLGEAVRARQPVVVIEAMKMENALNATRDGIVSDIQVREGQSVDAGTLLVVIV